MRLGVCFPTIRLQRAHETVARWRNAGFLPLVMINNIPGARFPEGCGAITKETYEGYFREVNLLCDILFRQAKADVVVCAGDGIWPDQQLDAASVGALFATKFPNGTGVMHSLYDKFPGSDGNCWAPMIGKGFYREFYGEGSGPFCHEYMQFSGGEELYDVAKREGILFETEAWRPINCRHPRDWQGEHNFKEYADKDRMVYNVRKRDGFPGSGTKGKLYLPEHVGKIILPSEF